MRVLLNILSFVFALAGGLQLLLYSIGVAENAMALKLMFWPSTVLLFVGMTTMLVLAITKKPNKK